jgi:hypothetical protein
MENSRELSTQITELVSQRDLVDVIDALVMKAKDGNVQAAKLLFDRLFGKQSAATASQPVLSHDERKAKLLRIIENLNLQGATDAEG